MTLLKETLTDGGTQVAPKNRDRLTVYVDSEILDRFKMEADAMYRNWSDHMNAILSDYYGRKDNDKAANTNSNSRGGK